MRRTESDRAAVRAGLAYLEDEDDEIFTPASRVELAGDVLKIVAALALPIAVGAGMVLAMYAPDLAAMLLAG